MALLLPIEVGDALDGHVVRLSRARGKDNLLWVRTDEGGHLTSCHLGRRLRLPAIGVRLRMRVAVHARKVRQHDIKHPRIQRGRSLWGKQIMGYESPMPGQMASP
eukprot:scaffold26652_cov126-Isochrysis_galbana.AAC.2